MDQTFAYFSSAEHKALTKFISDLSDDARHELTALMWLGRGDSGTDMEALISYARENSNPGDVGYITEKSPSLTSYLERGLSAI